MAAETRFVDRTVDDTYPILTLARMLDLEGATVYIVNEDGIHEGTFIRHEGEDIVFEETQDNQQATVHASNAHLFLRDAKNHYRVLAHETNWGARASDEDEDEE